ncbi:MAG: hypothetical protein M3P11_06590 [Actinomycetota bacterium]|nr:hypothetical protein [Actinomycetota bacterium]
MNVGAKLKNDNDAPSPRTAVPRGRRTIAAGHVVVVIVVTLLTWTLLYAPALERASKAQPPGARRTWSLIVLRPLSAISDVTRLSILADAVQRAAGRDPNVLAPAEPEPLPSAPKPKHSTAPPTLTTPMRTPTADNKLRVVIVGDSLAVGLGFELERVMSPGLAKVSSQGRISTGLARPDYFDWLNEMKHIEAVFHPDLVVVMLGENDRQALTTPRGDVETQIGTGPWPSAYRERAQSLANIAVDNGSHLVWVGLPIVRDANFWDGIQRQNAIYENVATTTPNSAYLDAWTMFATSGGRYTPFLRTDNGVVPIRESDGVHFTASGYTILARAALAVAEQRFALASKSII